MKKLSLSLILLTATHFYADDAQNNNQQWTPETVGQAIERVNDRELNNECMRNFLAKVFNNPNTPLTRDAMHDLFKCTSSIHQDGYPVGGEILILEVIENDQDSSESIKAVSTQLIQRALDAHSLFLNEMKNVLSTCANHDEMMNKLSKSAVSQTLEQFQDAFDLAIILAVQENPALKAKFDAVFESVREAREKEAAQQDAAARKNESQN